MNDQARATALFIFASSYSSCQIVSTAEQRMRHKLAILRQRLSVVPPVFRASEPTLVASVTTAYISRTEPGVCHRVYVLRGKRAMPDDDAWF